MRVRDVLAHKGTACATIDPEASVAQAVAQLATLRVGALVVSTDGRTVGGIVSERDVVRALHSRGAALLDAAVRDIMTADVLTCAPSDEISALASTMTEKRFRHMPVVVDGSLSGIMSIGDVVKSRVGELQTEHDQLMDYISTAR